MQVVAGAHCWKFRTFAGQPHRLLGHPGIDRELDDAQITTTGDRDHVARELRRVPLRHDDILPREHGPQ